MSERELDAFYRFANDLRYSFSNYEFANKRRRDSHADAKRWYRLQCLADKRFVLRMIRKIENFELPLASQTDTGREKGT